MLLGRCLTLALLVLGACAGFRGGWQSVAYIGDAPPAALQDATIEDRVNSVPELNVSGLRLRVTIDNDLRTYDTQVYLYALPLGVDPRRVYSRNHQPGKTRAFINVAPQHAGYVFRPEAVTLQVGDKRFAAERGFEFGQWDESGRRVESGGRWDHRPIEAPLALTDIGRRYLLSVDFATAVPSPESPHISLDLSQALRAANQPALPPIRFAPVRWKEGYT